MSTPWYKKATVQAALVSAITSTVIAIIAILSIYYTWVAANNQITLNKQQYIRDSIISNLQLQLLNKQIELANKSFRNDSIVNAQQLKIARENLAIQNNAVKVRNTASWGKLRNTMEEIMEILSNGNQGILSLDELSMNEKIKMSNKIWNLLNSEIGNPVLIENQKCLGYWRNCIARTKSMVNPSIWSVIKFSDQAGYMLKDIGVVWVDLVLDSDEVSPTGGLPKKK